MSHENSQTVYRTTPARTGKMMAIMLGICIVGGGIFFLNVDYWISEPAPVVAMMTGEVDHSGPAVATGITITKIFHLSNLLTLGLWHLMRYLEDLTTIQQFK